MRAGYNEFAIPIVAGVLFAYEIVITPAVGAILMSASTIIVAFNSRFLTSFSEKSPSYRVG